MRRAWPLLAAIFFFAAPSLTPTAHAQNATYALDQRFGNIAFSVDHLGLFSSHGEFRRFAGSLALDPTAPEHTDIEMRIDATSIDTPWDEALQMLRSPDYFDVAHYPDILFRSLSVSPAGPDRYRVRGTLRIRGVTQPVALEARLVERHTDATTHADIATFIVGGEVLRSSFGMQANKDFVDDTVHIEIRAWLQLGQPG
jgi:polyisoprenoid-binding protein YceI